MKPGKMVIENIAVAAMVCAIVIVLMRHLCRWKAYVPTLVPTKNSGKALCVYAYFHNGCDRNKHNLSFFLRYGVHARQHCDYIVVVNKGLRHGLFSMALDCDVPSHVEVVFRPNKGYDFGGYRHGVLHKKEVHGQIYSHYIFLNTSVRGPFVRCIRSLSEWPRLFLDLFAQNNVHLVGCTINSSKVEPHVQSMSFALTLDGLMLIWRSVMMKSFYHLRYAVLYQEVRMSRLILQNGWRIDCIAESLRGKEWNPPPKIDPNPTSNSGDAVYPGAYFGRTLTIHDVPFLKTNRGLYVPLQQEWDHR